jgi:hypothetical protein
MSHQFFDMLKFLTQIALAIYETNIDDSLYFLKKAVKFSPQSKNIIIETISDNKYLKISQILFDYCCIKALDNLDLINIFFTLYSLKNINVQELENHLILPCQTESRFFDVYLLFILRFSTTPPHNLISRFYDFNNEKLWSFLSSAIKPKLMLIHFIKNLWLRTLGKPVCLF